MYLQVPDARTFFVNVVDVQAASVPVGCGNVPVVVTVKSASVGPPVGATAVAEQLIAGLARVLAHAYTFNVSAALVTVSDGATPVHGTDTLFAVVMGVVGVPGMENVEVHTTVSIAETAVSEDPTLSKISLGIVTLRLTRAVAVTVPVPAEL